MIADFLLIGDSPLPLDNVPLFHASVNPKFGHKERFGYVFSSLAVAGFCLSICRAVGKRKILGVAVKARYARVYGLVA